MKCLKAAYGLAHGVVQKDRIQPDLPFVWLSQDWLLKGNGASLCVLCVEHAGAPWIGQDEPGVERWRNIKAVEIDTLLVLLT